MKGGDFSSGSALQSLLGGLALLAAAPLLERAVWPPTAPAWLALAYLTIAGSILGHSLSLIVVRDAGSVFASSWLYVSPPIATAPLPYESVASPFFVRLRWLFDLHG